MVSLMEKAVLLCRGKVETTVATETQVHSSAGYCCNLLLLSVTTINSDEPTNRSAQIPGRHEDYFVTVARDTLQGSGENYIMRSLMICTPHPMLFV